MKYVYLSYIFILIGLTSQLQGMDDYVELSQVTLALLTLKRTDPKHPASYADRWKYGFNGVITSIYQKTSPILVEPVGCIIEDAQPALLGGLWYADSYAPEGLIFLGKKKTASILEGYKDIESAMLLNADNIAIMWQDKSEKKLYITKSAIRDGAKVNLDTNKWEVSD